jgi:hypothetical protein
VTAPPIPRDDAIPQLALLLDVEAMTPLLQRSLGPDQSISATEIRYLHYRPARNVLVHYEVTIAGSPHSVVAFAEPASKLGTRVTEARSVELIRKVDGRTPAKTPLAYEPDHDVLIQWTPLDLELPALAESPERLLELLEAAGLKPRTEGELPRLVHSKPGRRSVLRWGDHYLKMYADDERFQRAVVGMRLAASLPIRSARCEATLPELRLTVQSFVEGKPPAVASEVAPEAGAFLAVLHAAQVDGVRRTPPAHRLRSVAKTARLLATIVPELEPRLGKLLSRLESTTPDGRLVLSHGDFFARQMLELHGDFAVIDFDANGWAPRALDLATYVTSLIRGTEDIPAGMSTLDALVTGYGSRPPGIPWYLAAVLIRRSSIPFRVLRHDWPEQVRERVAAAEAVLQL